MTGSARRPRKMPEKPLANRSLLRFSMSANFCRGGTGACLTSRSIGLRGPLASCTTLYCNSALALGPPPFGRCGARFLPNVCWVLASSCLEFRIPASAISRKQQGFVLTGATMNKQH